MIQQIVCPECDSTNCEESINNIKKKDKYLYPDKVKKLHCYLCYDYGASEISFEMKK